MNAVTSQASCDRCGTQASLARAWRKPVDALLLTEDSATDAGLGLLVDVGDVDAPLCHGCSAKLPQDGLAAAARGEGARYFTCGCGAKTRVRTLPADAPVTWPREGTLLVGEDDDRVDAATRHARTGATALATCSSCGAQVRFVGDDRTVTCVHCQAVNTMTDDTWTALRGARATRRFYVCFDPEMLARSARERCERLTASVLDAIKHKRPLADVQAELDDDVSDAWLWLWGGILAIPVAVGFGWLIHRDVWAHAGKVDLETWQLRLGPPLAVVVALCFIVAALVAYRNAAWKRAVARSGEIVVGTCDGFVLQEGHLSYEWRGKRHECVSSSYRVSETSKGDTAFLAVDGGFPDEAVLLGLADLRGLADGTFSQVIARNGPEFTTLVAECARRLWGIGRRGDRRRGTPRVREPDARGGPLGRRGARER